MTKSLHWARGKQSRFPKRNIRQINLIRRTLVNIQISSFIKPTFNSLTLNLTITMRKLYGMPVAPLYLKRKSLKNDILTL